MIYHSGRSLIKTRLSTFAVQKCKKTQTHQMSEKLQPVLELHQGHCASVKWKIKSFLMTLMIGHMWTSETSFLVVLRFLSHPEHHVCYSKHPNTLSGSSPKVSTIITPQSLFPSRASVKRRVSFTGFHFGMNQTHFHVKKEERVYTFKHTRVLFSIRPDLSIHYFYLP